MRTKTVIEITQLAKLKINEINVVKSSNNEDPMAFKYNHCIIICGTFSQNVLKTIRNAKYSFNSNLDMFESKNDNPNIPLDTKINDGCKPPDNSTNITINVLFLEIYANARGFNDNDSNVRKHGHINEN